MGVAVEEPVAEDHRHPRLRHQVCEVAAGLERPVLRIDVGHLDPVDPFERQHATAGVGPVDARHPNLWVPGEVLVERVGVPCLQPIIQLLPDRARELVHQLVRVDEVERTHAFLGEPRRLVEESDVSLDLARCTRALHLDGHLLAVRKRRAVDLTD